MDPLASAATDSSSWELISNATAIILGLCTCPSTHPPVNPVVLWWLTAWIALSWPMELSATHALLGNTTILLSEHVKFVIILAKHVLELQPIATLVTLPTFSPTLVVSVIVPINFSTQVPPLAAWSAHL